jgi:hypothetical protein
MACPTKNELEPHTKACFQDQTSASQQIFVAWLGNQKNVGGLAWFIAWLVFFSWLGFLQFFLFHNFKTKSNTKPSRPSQATLAEVCPRLSS